MSVMDTAPCESHSSHDSSGASRSTIPTTTNGVQSQMR